MPANNSSHGDEVIGIVHSCFQQKFGIPRQPRLAPAATAIIELFAPWNTMACLQGLEACSHIWLLFRFHQHQHRTPSATVRPPRLGGNQRIGVFATRSSFRPNYIGMSAVRLLSISENRGKPTLHIAGIDVLDQTPLLDIKPYVPYSDSIAEAISPWQAPTDETRPSIEFSPQANEACRQIAPQQPNFATLIVQLLRQDPRPAYHQQAERRYHMQLWQWDIHFYGSKTNIHVASITPQGAPPHESSH
ncbi:MAG: tRNA (N6-threonylcarbamoyladenosine(37)-N6)-methyltransferase TrmO [Mariprofundaceae bacterium]|nr:tRNA (N6-threonylcarbamoyladenosine(37)-N6)-methyltransferase TrmO [Mariprofundaceae bacterium]